MISILLSTYNRAEYLPKAIDSVLRQTLKDWELIISDDGSSDNTQEVLAPYLHDPRIRYFFHENVKPAQSRNLAARHSRGDYCAILDSDDYYAPDHLQNNLHYLIENNLDLCDSQPVLIGDIKNAWVPDKNNPNQLIHIFDCCAGGTLFFKRNVFEALHGFSMGFSEDGDFWERAQKAGFKMGKNPRASYYYSIDTPESMVKKAKKVLSL